MLIPYMSGCARVILNTQIPSNEQLTQMMLVPSESSNLAAESSQVKFIHTVLLSYIQTVLLI
jgi:hypothetical protein